MIVKHALNKFVMGQTLLEALLTLLFISFAALALIRFQNYLAYDNSLTHQMADATQLALSQTETLRNFQVMTTTSGYTAYSSIASGSTTSSSSTTTYTITWTITPFTSPTYKTANVTVTWNDRRGVAKSLTLVTNIAGVDPAYSSAIM